MKMCLVGAELFHAENQTDRHDETNSHFPQIAIAPKNESRKQCQLLHTFTFLHKYRDICNN